MGAFCEHKAFKWNMILKLKCDLDLNIIILSFHLCQVIFKIHSKGKEDKEQTRTWLHISKIWVWKSKGDPEFWSRDLGLAIETLSH
jgi:hypothetical protein